MININNIKNNIETLKKETIYKCQRHGGDVDLIIRRKTQIISPQENPVPSRGRTARLRRRSRKKETESIFRRRNM